ncbi:hypothetical protein MNBD_BACTEROID06-418, partial [hydrothermal vent metagenome]
MNKLIILAIFQFLASTVFAQEYKSYYSSGKLKEVGMSVNGKATGQVKVYHENGTLAEIGNFLNGEKTGEWKAFNLNSNLIAAV